MKRSLNMYSIHFLENNSFNLLNGQGLLEHFLFESMINIISCLLLKWIGQFRFTF